LTTHDFAFVPGLNNTATLWDGVIECMGSQVRAHVYTNPASDKVDAIATYWLERLPERFYLCGTSFGGYVAMAMLELAPQRVAGLALVCTSPKADTESQVAMRIKAIETVDAGDYESLVASQIGMAVHPDRLTDEALISRRNQMLSSYGKARYISHLKAAIDRPDRSHLLASYRQPKLLVAAAEDKLFPLAGMLALAAESGAEFEVIEQSGHLVALEQPEALAHVLSDWISHASRELL
jgi:pimeloyl-ACP methyl ester carboxylesterase